MKISIGIMAYNEEANIGQLLKNIENQKLNKVSIKEIIVVSSGSFDDTNQIVKRMSKKDKKIILIKEKQRKGKAQAINLFLKKAKSDIFVLCSGDIRIKENTIERLCFPFLNKKIGIIASRPIPTNSKDCFIGYTVHLLWFLHHEISKMSPKFGELIAFRNLFKEIGSTAVDEEHIAMKIIKENNFLPAYAEKAIIYNKGPETIKDFIRQRRRIYAGHIDLKRDSDYKAPTMSKINILNTLIRNSHLFNINTSHWLFGAVCLEAYCRFLGWWDLNIKNKKHYVWDIAKSTK
jgi:glycosyltransferase involved in cell wall biosynthesis